MLSVMLCFDMCSWTTFRVPLVILLHFIVGFSHQGHLSHRSLPWQTLVPRHHREEVGRLATTDLPCRSALTSHGHLKRMDRQFQQLGATTAICYFQLRTKLLPLFYLICLQTFCETQPVFSNI